MVDFRGVEQEKTTCLNGGFSVQYLYEAFDEGGGVWTTPEKAGAKEPMTI